MITRSVVLAVARRPGLWLEAARATWATAPRTWWRRPPFLPVPDSRYLAWRVHTAYGDEAAEVTPSDAVAYLEWRKRRRSRG